MEVKQWFIDFKPSEHIREICLLFTLFLLTFISIFIIVTNNRNDKITDTYSNYTKGEAYEHYGKQMAAIQAAMAAAVGVVNSTLPSTKASEITKPEPVVQAVVQSSVSQTFCPDDKKLSDPPSGSPPSILDTGSKINQGKTNPHQIILPFVVKHIPQSLTEDNYKPIVHTTSGTLEGIPGQFNGTKLDVFLGIPYAQPPIGDLRFRNPTKVKPSPDVVDCTSFKPHCLQKFNPVEVNLRSPTVNVMSEDCLYLNIWSPRKDENSHFVSSSNGKAKLKSIMIWFFGGGFQGGSNNLDEFDGRVLAAIGKVVVVTVNYRNGPLGYLDLGTSDVPGNQGLQDMITAIEWVKDNALAFNGDSRSVTLFGQSSGSIAISLLMSNNWISSMFRRTILQSGSPLIPGKMFKQSLTTSAKFAKNFGCYGNQNMTAAASCLRALSHTQLLNFYNSKTFRKLVFAPKSGDDLLPSLPEDIFTNQMENLQQGKYYNSTLDVMMGVTSNESSIMLALAFPEEFGLEKIKIQFNSIQDIHDFIEENVATEYGMSPEEAFLISNTFFPAGLSNLKSNELMKYFLKVTADLMFVCPTKLLAEKLASKTRYAYVYFYEFAQRWNKNPLGEWMGVTHGDDYGYVFGLPLRYPEKYTEDDIEVSNFMVKAWTNFAKTGNPGQRNAHSSWPIFREPTGMYMRITALNATLPVTYDKISQDTCEQFKQKYREL